MKQGNFKITVGSLPDRENLVAEIYYKNKGWVEISAETPNEFIIAFCNCDKENYWEFPFDEAMEVLQEAKNRLAKLQRTDEQQKEHDERMKSYESEP